MISISSDYRRFDYLSWPNASNAARHKGSTLVWPFGALEQHGPHLPLNTDALFAKAILSEVLKALPDDLPIWMLPPPRGGIFARTQDLPWHLVIV